MRWLLLQREQHRPSILFFLLGLASPFLDSLSPLVGVGRFYLFLDQVLVVQNFWIVASTIQKVVPEKSYICLAKSSAM